MTTTDPQHSNLATAASLVLFILGVVHNKEAAEDIAHAMGETQSPDRQVAIAGMFRYFCEVSHLEDDEAKHPIIPKCRQSLTKIGCKLIRKLAIRSEDIDFIEDWLRADLKEPQVITAMLSWVSGFRDVCRDIQYEQTP